MTDGHDPNPHAPIIGANSFHPGEKPTIPGIIRQDKDLEYRTQVKKL
jgi:hypothetical protein